jgi:hypothetical protein
MRCLRVCVCVCREIEARGVPRWIIHNLQPWHVRNRRVHCCHQPTSGTAVMALLYGAVLISSVIRVPPCSRAFSPLVAAFPELLTWKSLACHLLTGSQWLQRSCPCKCPAIGTFLCSSVGGLRSALTPVTSDVLWTRRWLANSSPFSASSFKHQACW